MTFVVGYFVGLLIGVVVAAIGLTKMVVGDLRVDNSDPDSGPYLFLELAKPMAIVQKKHYVILKVNLKDYDSQK